LVVDADRAVPLPEGMSLRRAALSEPFSVSYHAVVRAGDLRVRTLLVTGAGPIGSLAVAAARHAGAETIVASDLTDHALAQARQMGADVLLRADRRASPRADSCSTPRRSRGAGGHPAARHHRDA